MNKLALTYKVPFLFLRVMRGVLTAALVLPWVTPTTRNRLIQSWSSGLLRSLRVTVRVQGAFPPSHQLPVMLTANHVSWVDIFVIHSVHPVRFVSKAEVRNWPVFGWLAARTGTLFLVRASRKHTSAIGGEMVGILRQGDSLGLFPESTTSDGSSVLPFRSSLLQAAISCNVSVLPVALSYRLADGSSPNRHIPFIGEMSFAQSLFSVLTGPPSLVELRIGPLTHVTQLHRRELAAQLENITVSLLSAQSGLSCDGSVVRNPPEIGHGLPAARQ